MITDIEISKKAKTKNIGDIAEKIGIPKDKIEPFGKFKAKIPLDYCFEIKNKPSGKLILVSATTPTPAGEGKTTNTIGITDALNRIGKKTAAVLRQPSLGPVFGMKGGATGGGFAQVYPMEEINLHFTGDLHAITTAHNLIAALLDNAIYQHKIEIDPKRILWKRVLDINDRSLRNIIIGLGKPTDGILHESGFDITAASEIMAIFCFSKNILDLKEKIGNILLGYNYAGNPVFVKDLGIAGAATVLLKDAINPNIVQTLENNPAFIHGGPFANIAQGYNSILATQLALHTNDFVVTEAGFGSDLGAEKFFDLVCPYGGFTPALMVLVTTIRTLKYQGGQMLDHIKQENQEALEKGFENLGRHLENAKKFGVDTIVVLNKYASDFDEEVQLLTEYCKSMGIDIAVSEVYEKGGAGGESVANLIVQHLNQDKTEYHPIYDWALPVEEKIRIVAKEIYRAKDIEFTEEAQEDLKSIIKLNLCKLPICIAKTQYSFSDNPQKLGAPSGFILRVRRILIASGAGFLIPLTGDIIRMPGLPKIAQAESIDIDFHGNITGIL